MPGSVGLLWVAALSYGATPMSGPVVNSIGQLVGVAVELGALEHARITPRERVVVKQAEQVDRGLVVSVREHLLRGDDPLGDAFCALRTASERRGSGATFTPNALVTAMVNWVKPWEPERIVDPGSGSGRFIIAAGRAMAKPQLIAVELDPLCALMLRAQLAVTGLAHRTTVCVADYPSLRLKRIPGRTAFIGNPPYVRHHSLTPQCKRWYVESAANLGVQASQLAGLHAHFILATALKASPRDVGCFVTAAEWLDVNYGSALRTLFVEHLGLRSLQLVEPTAKPFPDADTTAVICCFETDTKVAAVKVSRVNRLRANGALERGRAVSRAQLRDTPRWTSLTRGAKSEPGSYVELGELCRVHRGQVTGQNQVWIVDSAATELPLSVLFAAVTRARELFAAGFAITDAAPFRCVIDIPPELDRLSPESRRLVDRFLRRARAAGADANYIAQHRKPWWSVGLRKPAPILATYMARRPPAFVRNLADLRHVNIAHGLYPRLPMTDKALDELTRYLQTSVSCSDGRVYCGGLAKFEPKEMERLLVPAPC
jgi:adenine-specific DNA-methyltransferase